MILKKLSLKQFEDLAQSLGRKMKDQGLTIGLIGPLGAGKTTFAKALARQMGAKRAKSPSFVIMHQYRIGKRTLYHLDFYRLNKVEQLNVLGLEEIFSSKNIIVMEWLDKFPQLKKFCDLTISIKINKDGTRTVAIKFNK